ncbi:MAG TPA: molybdate ABC transporter substrate-binding protein [Acidobacteriota bacterium]|nr:molybdate ABC transporter substrate-binding protein [Acidobacteriota bacterium]
MFQKRMIRLLLLLGSICGLLQARPFENKQSEILVSAAVSLKNAFENIGALYEKQTGVRVRFNLGASGLLQKQIETGAPVDVFASAGASQMDALQAKGLILENSRRNFTRNTLVLVAPAKSSVPIHSFADLARPEVKRIAIGSPKTVPAGQYARQTLESMKLWDKLQPRLVLAENARQILDYVARGETEAGILYASDVLAVPTQVAVAARAPEKSHSPIVYPIAIVKESSERDNAQRFVDLTLSREGQAILAKYGFLNAP